MASGNTSGFSKEQLALAKQLQSGYVSSGTFHSQGNSGPPKTSSSAQQASRMPHATPPVRSQPPPPPRSTNGLVRPLPAKAPLGNAGVSRPVPPNTAAARTTQPVSRPYPGPPSAPRDAHASLPVARSATQSNASTAPAVQPIRPSQAYTRPPPMPTNLQPAMTPVPLHSVARPTQQTAQQTARPAAQPAARPAAAHSMSESRNTNLLKSAFNTTPGTSTAASAARQTMPAQAKHRDDAVAKAVMQGIKINQMGKPIKWNWASEEPVARELTQDELDQMRARPALPPLVYDRPFHENATMKATSSGGDAMDISESPPRKPIGLKGSRHAQ